MAGWNLKVGEIKNLKKKEETLDNEIKCFLSKKNTMKNIYKLFLFQSILEIATEEIDKIENENIFGKLVYFFGEKFWDFVNEIPQDTILAIYNGYTNKSSQEENIELIKRKYHLSDVKFSELKIEIKKDYLEMTKEILKRNVIGALYDNFENSIYSFNIKTEEIKMNKYYFFYFKNNEYNLKLAVKYRILEFLKVTEKNVKKIKKIANEILKIELEENGYIKINEILI